MGSLKGTRTEKNILTAFAGESQARNRYSFYAKQAKKEGYEQIAAIFDRTAEQERAHAKALFKMLEGGEVEVTAAFPAGVIGTTLENLEAAAAGEEHEFEEMYPEFAKVAEEEGFSEIACVFRAIATSEKQHAKQYRDFIDNLKSGKVFKREDTVVWYCRKCGYIHEGTEPPKKCPACAHPQSYYELLGENW
ncbi:rubrerythrin [Desulfolithobacter dissulfuricans]|uniref:Rubrerythrin n=1 Tax=Desulfolithobacter dissulfuricans TaxID=2795293 RepID=A0A915U3G7_9BACT|nr:rubrerythrin family protein [Desulfolithobacter dissulfuricans]BCO10666.1 rubrerythrin [Desulfolithobacter dissulfuricans]